MSARHEPWDIIIIGGGAAAFSAALYSARRQMKTLVIAKDVGGQALLTHHIENYPGIDSVVTGADLLTTFWKQAERYGAVTHIGEVVSVEEREQSGVALRSSSPRMRGSSIYAHDLDSRLRGNDDTALFYVTTSTGEKSSAHAIILAFGMTPRNMGVPGEKEFANKGIHYCAICDGPLYKNKTVAVVGGTNAAMDAALFLAKKNPTVYLLYNRGRLSGNTALIEQIKETKNIEYVVTTAVNGVHGGDRVKTLAITTPDGSRDLAVDGVFVEMGYYIQTDFVKDFVALGLKKDIVVDAQMRTSRAGVFAAGDVTTTPYKQLVISAGEGATAALEAYQYVERKKGQKAIITIDWE